MPGSRVLSAVILLTPSRKDGKSREESKGEEEEEFAPTHTHTHTIELETELFVDFHKIFLQLRTSKRVNA